MLRVMTEGGGDSLPSIIEGVGAGVDDASCWLGLAGLIGGFGVVALTGETGLGLRGSSTRRDAVGVLDGITVAGGFGGVVLTGEVGLVVNGSSTRRDAVGMLGGITVAGGFGMVALTC